MLLPRAVVSCGSRHHHARRCFAAAAAGVQQLRGSGSSSSGRPTVHHHSHAAAAAAAAAPTDDAAASLLPPAPFSFAERPGVWDADSGKLQLKNLTLEELQEWCESMGHDARKALLLWKAMYQDGRWARSLDEDDAEEAAAGQQHASSRRGSCADLQLSSALKAAVQQHASLHGGLSMQSVTTARDGTHKLIFSLHGTSGSVETVLIPMKDRGGQRLRYTACLSSQVGCAMNCQFCFTGRMGLLSNLTTAQIVEQLVEARRWLAQHTAAQHQQQLQEQQEHSSPQQLGAQQEQQHAGGSSAAVLQAADVQASGDGSSSSSRKAKRERKQGSQQEARGPRVGNIVFMGMGEPLHNPAVTPALDILCHHQGLGLSRNKVIVSTVGLLPQLRELRASGKAKLAVSLHATTEDVRSWIVPLNRRYPLAELIATLKELYPLRPAATASDAAASSSDSSSSSESSSSRQRSRPASKGLRSDDFVLIEYVLLKDVNDTDADAHRLLELLSEVYCMINLIVFNPHEGTVFQKSDEAQARRFQQIVQAGGKVCTLRISKGDDEMAACGQLGGASMGLAGLRPAPMLQPPERLRDSLPGAAAAVAAMRGATGSGGVHGGLGRARQVLLKRRRQLAPVPRSSS